MENEKPQSEKKSVIHFSIPAPGLVFSDLKVTKPEKYPCFVLRVVYGQYFIMPLFFIASIEDLPEKLPEIFRLIVVDEIPSGECDEKLIRTLKKVLLWECERQGWQGCLALNPERGIYYFPSTEKFNDGNTVPTHSHWLKESEFLSYRQQDIDAGKTSAHRSPLKEIYFDESKGDDFTLLNQIEAKGHSVAATELFGFNV